MTDTMPRLVRVKPQVAIVPVGPENVLLKGPALFLRYSGEAVPPLLKLVPLLDGTRDLAALARDSGLSEEDTRDLVEALWEDRAVEDAEADGAFDLPAAERARLAPQIGLWSHLTRDPGAVQNRLGKARVLVAGDGRLAKRTADALRDAGVGHVAYHDAGADTPAATDDLAALVKGADHLVVALDLPFRNTLLAFNDAALATGTRWTAAFLDSLEASVGPTVVPGETACWRCYDLRMKGAHPNMERLLVYEANERQVPARAGLDVHADIASGWLVQSVLLSIGGAVLPPLAGKVQRIRFLDLHAETHRVLRMPRCPSCTRADIPDVDRYDLDPVKLS